MAWFESRFGAGPRLAARVSAQAAFGLFALVALWALLREELAALDASRVLEGASAHRPGTLLAVALLAALSWSAVSAYDVIALRAAGLRLKPLRAMACGLAASGLGQTLGFGLLVGAFVRWRMLRGDGLTPLRAARAAATVALGFFGGLAALLVASAAVFPEVATRLEALPAWAGPAAALAVVAAFVLIRRRGASRSALAFVALAAMDAAPAALALWLLLGEASVEAVFAAYLIALAAGLLSNTPGGVGAFEGALILSLPDVPVETLLSAVIVFRVFFHAAPAAAGLALLGAAEFAQRPRRVRPADPRIAAARRISGRAEDALFDLGDKRAVFGASGEAFLMAGVRAGALIAIGDPIGPRARQAETVAALPRAAMRRGRVAMLYRAGGRTAAIARARGFLAMKIGAEAFVDPSAFDLGASSRRRLRRKVRQAESAGLAIRHHAPGQAPVRALAEISAEWLAAKGGRERSFSVGRFDASWLRRHPVLEARDAAGRPVAFVSLWVSGDGSEWSIDLMRARGDAPQGSVAALFAAAIGEARAAGARRFSLCMAPLAGIDPAAGPAARLLSAIRERDAGGVKGLEEFKASFAPSWAPRYALLPRTPLAGLALLGLALLLRPRPER